MCLPRIFRVEAKGIEWKFTVVALPDYPQTLFINVEYSFLWNEYVNVLFIQGVPSYVDQHLIPKPLDLEL